MCVHTVAASGHVDALSGLEKKASTSLVTPLCGRTRFGTLSELEIFLHFQSLFSGLREKTLQKASCKAHVSAGPDICAPS